MSLINQMLQDLEQRKVDMPVALGQTYVPMFPANKNKHLWYVSPQLILAVSVAVMAIATVKIYQKQSVQPMPVELPSMQALDHNEASLPMMSEAHASVFKPLQASTQRALGLEMPTILPSKANFQPVLDKTLAFSLADGRLTSVLKHEKSMQGSVSAPIAVLPTKVAYIPNVQVDAAPLVLPSTPLVDANLQAAVVAPSKKNSEKTMFAKHVSPEQEALNDYHQAIALVQQGRMTEAQEKLKKSLQTYPTNLEVRQVLASLLIEDKRKPEAISLLKEGLTLTPDQSQMTLTLARLLLETGQAVEAIDALEKGLPYANHDAQYYAFLAMLMQRAGRHQDAIDNFQAAIKFSGETPVWLIGLAVSLQAEGRAQEAYSVFAKVRPMAMDADSKSFVEARLKQLATSQSN